MEVKGTNAISENIGKKVLLDTIVEPITAIPFVLGASGLILGWGMGAGVTVCFLGALGMLVGVGIAITKLVFGLETAANKALQDLHAQSEKEQTQQLDELDARLVKDRDPRTQKALRQLRALYESFQANVNEGKIQNRSHFEIVQKVDELFHACVSQLQYTYDIWESCRDMSGQARKEAKVKRIQAVEEVIVSIEVLSTTIDGFNTVTTSQKKQDLRRLRKELAESLHVAKTTEERIAAFGNKSYDESEFLEEAGRPLQQ